MNSAAARIDAAPRNEVLAELRRKLQALEQAPALPSGESPPRHLSTGFAGLDAALGGGLHCRALNEIHVAAAGSGALEALLPSLARAGDGQRLLTWVHPSRTPYPPALVQQGFDLRRWLVLRPTNEDDHRWAIDQALRSGACDAVVAHVGDLDDRQFRRLQLAAEEGESLGLLIRPAALATRPSPAALRLLATPVPAGDPDLRRVRFEVLRCRGLLGSRSVEVEWSRVPMALRRTP